MARKRSRPLAAAAAAAAAGRRPTNLPRPSAAATTLLCAGSLSALLGMLAALHEGAGWSSQHSLAVARYSVQPPARSASTGKVAASRADVKSPKHTAISLPPPDSPFVSWSNHNPKDDGTSSALSWAYSVYLQTNVRMGVVQLMGLPSSSTECNPTLIFDSSYELTLTDRSALDSKNADTKSNARQERNRRRDQQAPIPIAGTVEREPFAMHDERMLLVTFPVDFATLLKLKERKAHWHYQITAVPPNSNGPRRNIEGKLYIPSIPQIDQADVAVTTTIHKDIQFSNNGKGSAEKVMMKKLNMWLDHYRSIGFYQFYIVDYAHDPAAEEQLQRMEDVIYLPAKGLPQGTAPCGNEKKDRKERRTAHGSSSTDQFLIENTVLRTSRTKWLLSVETDEYLHLTSKYHSVQHLLEEESRRHCTMEKDEASSYVECSALKGGDVVTALSFLPQHEERSSRKVMFRPEYTAKVTFDETVAEDLNDDGMGFPQERRSKKNFVSSVVGAEHAYIDYG